CSSRAPHPDALHSFPPRRSSDLAASLVAVAAVALFSLVLYLDLRVRRAERTLVTRDKVQLLQLEAQQLADAGKLQDAQRKLEGRSEEHTSELQSLAYLVCRLLLE